MSDWSSIDKVLQDSRTFTAPWEAKLQTLGGNQGTSASTALDFAKERSLIRAIILGPTDSLTEFSSYVKKRTIEEIRKNSRSIRNCHEIDVVNSVATSAWTEAVARLLGIPFKTLGASQSVFDSETHQENLTVLFRYIFSFSRLDAMQELALRRNAVQANERLRKAINEVCEAIKCSAFAHLLLHRHRGDSSDDVLREHGSELLQRLFESGKTVEEVVSLVSLLAVQIVVPSVFAVSCLNTSRLPE